MPDLEALAAAQRRVVRAAQLVECGFSAPHVSALARRQQWARVFHGVYAIPPYDEPWDVVVLRAALLYAGAGAAVCHLSRLALEGIWVGALEPVHIAVPAERDVRSTSGLVVHRLAGISAATHPRWPELRVVPAARALAHAYSEQVSRGDRLALACAVLVPRVVRPGEVAAAAPLTMRHRRELLNVTDAVAVGCHSGLEIDYFVEVERRHGLPLGRRQARIRTRSGVFVVDVLYADARLVVEIDGRHHELDPAQRRADELRDAELRALGYRVLRVTVHDLRNPAALAARIRRLLAAAA